MWHENEIHCYIHNPYLTENATIMWSHGNTNLRIIRGDIFNCCATLLIVPSPTMNYSISVPITAVPETAQLGKT